MEKKIEIKKILFLGADHTWKRDSTIEKWDRVLRNIVGLIHKNPQLPFSTPDGEQVKLVSVYPNIMDEEKLMRYSRTGRGELADSFESWLKKELNENTLIFCDYAWHAKGKNVFELAKKQSCPCVLIYFATRLLANAFYITFCGLSNIFKNPSSFEKLKAVGRYQIL